MTGNIDVDILNRINLDHKRNEEYHDRLEAIITLLVYKLMQKGTLNMDEASEIMAAEKTIEVLRKEAEKLKK